MSQLTKKLKVMTIGGATTDVFFKTKQGELVDNAKDVTKQKLVGFEYGAKINIDSDAASFSFGGGAANSAVSLARLGCAVSSFLSVGNDKRGDEILENLKREKVKLLNVSRSNLASGLSVVVVYGKKTKDHVLFTFRGANEMLDIEVKEFEKEKPDWIYMSSLSGKKWLRVLNKVFAWAAKHTVKVAWNPGALQIGSGVDNLKTFLKRTDLLLVNKDEAIEMLLKKNGQEMINPRKLVYELNKYNSRAVCVVTDGAKGAYASYQKRIYFQAVKTVKEQDTTGVGDAFGSTFLWAMEFFKGDIKAALEVATVNAGAVISRQGAQAGLLSKGQLLKKL